MWETWVLSLWWEDPWRRKGLPTPVFWLENSMDCKGSQSQTRLSNFHFTYSIKIRESKKCSNKIYICEPTIQHYWYHSYPLQSLLWCYYPPPPTRDNHFPEFKVNYSLASVRDAQHFWHLQSPSPGYRIPKSRKSITVKNQSCELTTNATFLNTVFPKFSLFLKLINNGASFSQT